MAQRKPEPVDTRSQRQKFIDVAREHGASEDEAVFERAVRKVAKAPPQKPKKAAARERK
jgi:hypothetical protein